MKRLAWSATIAATLLILLAACQPAVTVETNVLPTLISVAVPTNNDGTIVLQGRYFGDGQGGNAENSYVILGADVSGNGGVRATAAMWSSSRIELGVPGGVGAGFIFVVVNGVRSNGLPANLP